MGTVFRVHLTTGVCDYSERLRYAYNLAIGDNKLHAFGRYGNRTTWNLSSSTPSKINCSSSVYSHMRYSNGTAVDPSGNYFYVAYNTTLYRHTIDGSGCVGQAYQSLNLGRSYLFYASIRFHPTNDNILYAANRYRHNVVKITLNSSSFSATAYKTVGRCCRGTSNASRQYIYYPYGIAIDKTNNRVWTNSYYNGSAIGLSLIHI